MEKPTVDFTAYHPDNYDRQAHIHVNSREPLGMGIERKERIRGTLTTTSREIPISMIRRNFSNGRFWPAENRIFAERTLESWRLYKKVGLPTYDTLRIAQDGSLLVTDVCADGSRTYGNESLWVDIKNNRLLRSKEDTAIDNILIELTSPENIGVIQQKAEEIGNMATDNGIQLPGDPLELIVHPDGTWDLKTLDVREAYKSVYPGYENERLIKKLIEDLKTTRESIVDYQKKNLIQKLTGYLGHRIEKMNKSISRKLNRKYIVIGSK